MKNRNRFTPGVLAMGLLLCTVSVLAGPVKSTATNDHFTLTNGSSSKVSVPLKQNGNDVLNWEGQAGHTYGIYFSFECWIVDDAIGTILFYTMEARSPGGPWTPLDPTRNGRAGCSSLTDDDTAALLNSDLSTVWTASATGTQELRVLAWLYFGGDAVATGFIDEISLVIVD